MTLCPSLCLGSQHIAKVRGIRYLYHKVKLTVYLTSWHELQPYPAERKTPNGKVCAFPSGFYCIRPGPSQTRSQASGSLRPNLSAEVIKSVQKLAHADELLPTVCAVRDPFLYAPLSCLKASRIA